ncbi:hypothetical protein H8S90_22095 [Olivibacter sp. SDN3]|uniref:hypothetical protein n=1 Tax=Olivibacter sp. SDN3 TaxID=2764720 RepID=UPI0016518AD9|nr:hypothetical protein [Olivibacter sp. SDN3]QNL49388.1 hypothetical protein H8S90_22095 [Olivibacter sp. SDN3]
MIISNLFDKDLIADAVNLAIKTSQAPIKDQTYTFTTNSPLQTAGVNRVLLAINTARVWDNIGKKREALSLNFTTLKFLINGGKEPFQYGPMRYDCASTHGRLLLIDRLLSAVDHLLSNNEELRQTGLHYLTAAIKMFKTNNRELHLVLCWLTAYLALMNMDYYAFLENAPLLFTDKNGFLGASKRVMAYHFLSVFRPN